MPTLQEGSTGAVVNSLQTLLTNGSAGQWNTTPQGIDGNFGSHTKAAVVAFQAWGGVAQDGVVGDQRPGRFPCMRRGPRWKQRWGYSS
jgi:peptidoglycan hydrolase-like protein with peptidoglycan-binding domain